MSANGPAPRLPLVLLHGFLGEARDFDPLRPWLGDRPLIAFDLPGHGQRPDPLEGHTFAAVVAQVLRAIRARGVARCDLLGYSLGARLALAALAADPALVARAVAVGGGAGIEDPRERAERRAADLALAARLESEDFAAVLRGWYDQGLFASLREQPIFSEMLARRRQGDPRALAAALRGLGAGTQPPLHAALAASLAPVLLIAGEKDAKYVALHRALAARWPAASCRTIAGAGHAVHLEQPRALGAAVAEFLARQP